MYTNYKDINDFYNRVREFLGISSMFLSDTQIDLEDRAPKSERMIKGRIEDWQTLTDDKLLDFQSAIVIQTAINSYNKVSKNAVKSQQQPALKVEFRDSVVSEYENLQNQLDSLILSILGLEETSFSNLIVT